MLDRRFHHIVVLAHTSSFSRAAEKVGITQSGITRSVADLESELGYALFYRTGRGVTPTERGRDFIERAGQLIEDTRSLMSGGDEKGDPYARSLRIGVAPASLEWRLAEPLAALISRHPSLRFQIQGSSPERCVHQLRSGGVDVAMGFEEAFSDWSDLQLERIGMASPVLYVRHGHPLLEKRSVSSKDLTGFECVTPSDSQTFGKTLRDLFLREGVPWQRHLHIIDHQMIAQHLVARSQAFGLTSEQVATTAAFKERFQRLPVEGLFTPLPLCCATRARWELSRPVLAFLSVMRSVSAGAYSESV
jgi:DNA-binding transcriptional LysR family regulator